jgi:glutamate synthase (NADPH) large chain
MRVNWLISRKARLMNDSAPVGSLPLPQGTLPTLPRTLRGGPVAQGLYDPANEHDACGVSFVCNLKGIRSHDIVDKGLTALEHMEHRGASGAEVNTGDGAGILVQMPHEFFQAILPFELPAPGEYAAGMVFLPQDQEQADRAVAQITKIIDAEGMRTLGWRYVTPDSSTVGPSAKAVMPQFRQLFLRGIDPYLKDMALERRAFVVRKRIENEVAGVYFPSLSYRTIIYKGMLTTEQLRLFFADLRDPRFVSAIALVHSRFSTNTFPSWPLSHPYRYVAHNGEINTVQGNRNWMRARESMLASDVIPGDLKRLYPIVQPGGSDSASFDNVLELLHLDGRPLQHAVLMMIPEAWENHATMSPELKAFYQFHASLMEPWDGPASIAFTDGTVIGAVLDRNGLRPSRYWVTSDDTVIMASEVGVLDIDQSTVVKKGRLQPGRMFLVDTDQGRIVDDNEIKSALATEHPYEDWLHAGLLHIDDLPDREHQVYSHESVLRRQQVFGYTQEDLKLLIAPMAKNGQEALGSMGTDTPIAVLSDRPRLLFDYFVQLFAQVTNPPLDAIREELVTSLGNSIGPEGNLLNPGPSSCRQVTLSSPVIDNDELAKLIHVNDDGDMSGFMPHLVKGLFPVADDGEGLRRRIEEIRVEVSNAITDGAKIIILSDRDSTPELAPIPSLMLVAAVHHHLIREKSRTKVSIVVEAGDCREVHHACLLIGFGASAINPYLAMETIEDMIRQHELQADPRKAVKAYIKALSKGILKVMSKMGISTVSSYMGAQVFEAIGLNQALVDEYFTGTVSRLGGIGIETVSAEVAARHARAYPERTSARAHRTLDWGGEYQWRREGEYHLFNPDTVFKLQHATRSKRYDIFKEYTKAVNDQSQHLATLRGLFEFRFGLRAPISIDEVEPVSEIVKRFSTGAMSYGSISAEAHETLAIAMNRIGAKSNTGEGGEDPERFVPMENGDSKRSAIKQVASGRFGVTSEYLVNADDIQIKMAQGAKPGEGGQLPGHKVYPWIAKTRHSTPGVGLISPPPHHDIYSIEDLAQLIHDLKNANNQARVHVKLVAEVGVGTVAAGVSKAHADVVLISGHDGGTGASPLTSLKHAGGPWELGLAETQQTLLLNGLRDRIVVQADGQLKTGRDVIVAALLGAEEFGFATAPLVVSGCIMMRVCHLDTCPVGVATQNPELRKKFSGKPEFVVNFFEYIAEEVRELMAQLGFRTLEEMVGQAELLDTTKAVDHWKTVGLDLSPIFYVPSLAEGAPRRRVTSQDHGLAKALDNTLIELCEGALNDARPVNLELPIRNINRTVGTMLGAEVTRRYGGEGLPENTIQIHFRGSAGNSFGAFVPAGMTLRVEGDCNDYVGKGLSGGTVAVFPDRDAPAGFVAEENVIAGNVILYGATKGSAFLRGTVGERFCVRNSGATAVVEGVGDHACEYMTGGRVVVLGKTGRNFGAGMSGGTAFVYDPDGRFPGKVNREMVDIDPLSDEDKEWLHAIVTRHHHETSSTVAEQLLADWTEQVKEFVKVMPQDFKRVLRASAAAVAEGRNVDDAIMAAARA